MIIFYKNPLIFRNLIRFARVCWAFGPRRALRRPRTGPEAPLLLFDKSLDLCFCLSSGPWLAASQLGPGWAGRGSLSLNDSLRSSSLSLAYAQPAYGPGGPLARLVELSSAILAKLGWLSWPTGLGARWSGQLTQLGPGS